MVMARSAAVREFYMIVPTYSELAIRRAVSARLKVAKDE